MWRIRWNRQLWQDLSCLVSLDSFISDFIVFVSTAEEFFKAELWKTILNKTSNSENSSKNVLKFTSLLSIWWDDGSFQGIACVGVDLLNEQEVAHTFNISSCKVGSRTAGRINWNDQIEQTSIQEMLFLHINITHRGVLKSSLLGLLLKIWPNL